MLESDEGRTETSWFAEAVKLVDTWFTLEDPTRLEPFDREMFVETEVETPEGPLVLRGIVDRLDVAPDGADPGRRLQDGSLTGGAVRAQGAVPDAVLRPRPLAAARGRAADAPAGLPRRQGGPALLPRRGRPARHRAQRHRLVGARSVSPPRPATGDPVAPGCATGATTRPSAPSGVAPHPRCPTARPSSPSTRASPVTSRPGTTEPGCRGPRPLVRVRVERWTGWAAQP